MKDVHFYKNILFLCLIVLLFSGCKSDKIYSVEPFDVRTNLNVFTEGSRAIFTQRHLKSKKEKWVGGIFGGNQFPEWNEVLYKDSVIRIDPQVKNAVDTEAASEYPSKERSQFDFYDVTFINPQKTSFIARISGPYNIGNRYFVFTAQPGGLKIYSIDRTAVIKNDDKEAYREMLKVGNDLLMVDNDYIFNQKNGKAYEITRPGKDRIRGPFSVLSPDRQTITFDTDHGFYQCHYPTGKTYTESAEPADLDKLVKDDQKKWPYNYFSWTTDENGVMFMKGKRKIS